MAIPFDPDIVEMLLAQDTCAGEAEGFAWRLGLRQPSLAAAIHAGHRVRPELLPLMALSEAGRLYEEDAATEQFVADCPNALWALDSRAEYDLNRPAELALPLTPERFWGTRVYAGQPDAAMNAHGLAKHEAFYRFLASVAHVLVQRCGALVVYDVHSYNIGRQRAKGMANPPEFNLGTALLDRARWGRDIDAWLELLASVAIPGAPVRVSENEVFSGQGELCRRLTGWDERILVLPTEISKVYMDEDAGELRIERVLALRRQLAAAMTSHAEDFRARHCAG